MSDIPTTAHDHLAHRRSFEDAVVAAMEDARATGRPVAMIIGTMMGLAPVTHLGGLVSVERTVVRVLELVSDLVRQRGIVERIGATEIGVLLPDANDQVARNVRHDINLGMELLEREFPDTHVGLAMALTVGPEPAPGADADLLWRTADRAFRARSSMMQQGMQGVVMAGASSLDEVARRLLDAGLRIYALDASTLEVGDRRWSAPDPPPDPPPDGIRPLVASSGANVGFWHWWGKQHTPDPLAMDEVFQAVANAIERILAVESSEWRARRDGLTGLLNREGLAHAMREVHAPYAVGVIDIDHFKEVNDRYGHEVGDECLKALADLLRLSRASDLVARWGGEELVIVMPGTTSDGAAAGLRRILDKARETIITDGTPLSFSAGVAVIDDDLLGLLDGIRAADGAMYEAKRRGRGQVVASDGL